MQSLHPSHFDRGHILLQERFQIPEPDEINVETLLPLLGKIGAQLLLKGLENCIFVSPSENAMALTTNASNQKQERHAPKITPEDRHINWNAMKSEDILRRHRIIGPLWSNVPSRCHQDTVRVKWSNGWRLVEPDLLGQLKLKPGQAMLYQDKCLSSVVVGTAEGKLLQAERFVIPGKPELAAKQAALHGGFCDLIKDQGCSEFLGPLN